MTDKPVGRNKLPPVNKPAKGSWPVIGTRAHPDDIHLIDRAALAVGVKRSEFMLQATLKEARRVLRTGERGKGGRRDPFAEVQAA